MVADALDYAPVKGTTLIVLIALAEFANDDDTAWPSVTTLARRSRCTPRNVRKAMNELEGKGLVQRLRNAGPNGVNRYRISIQQPLPGGTLEGGEQNSALNVGPATAGTVVPPEPPVEPQMPQPTLRDRSYPASNITLKATRSRPGRPMRANSAPRPCLTGFIASGGGRIGEKPAHNKSGISPRRGSCMAPAAKKRKSRGPPMR